MPERRKSAGSSMLTLALYSLTFALRQPLGSAYWLTPSTLTVEHDVAHAHRRDRRGHARLARIG